MKRTQPKKRASKPLQTVVIRTHGGVQTVGEIYFRTSTHVVLLNHRSADVHLGGELSRRVGRHKSQEADITIIPDAEVIDVRVLV